MRKGEAVSLVVADGREEVRAGGKESSEHRRQWRAAARLLLRVGGSEVERASGGACLAAGAKAGAVGRTSWPTRARPSRRMRATRRSNAAGVPWRSGVAVRARGRGAGAVAGRGVSAGGLGQLRPAGQKRGRSLLAPPFPFSIFLNFFSQLFFQTHFDYFNTFFSFSP